jgi:hypothetical protein
MSKIVLVCAQRAIEISVLNHGEQQAFGEGVQHCIVNSPVFRPDENVKVLKSTLVILYRARASFPDPFLEP